MRRETYADGMEAVQLESVNVRLVDAVILEQVDFVDLVLDALVLELAGGYRGRHVECCEEAMIEKSCVLSL